MNTSECLLTSIDPGFGEGATGRSADAARSRGLFASVDAREKDGDSDFADWRRCGWTPAVLVSSLGALGAVPKDLSLSSNSRLEGIDGRFGIRPGLTHCMLLGPPLIGARGAENEGRSVGGYIEGGLGAMGVRSALGPVGILAGRLFGDVLTSGGPPLREPRPDECALGDASRGA